MKINSSRLPKSFACDGGVGIGPMRPCLAEQLIRDGVHRGPDRKRSSKSRILRPWVARRVDLIEASTCFFFRSSGSVTFFSWDVERVVVGMQASTGTPERGTDALGEDNDRLCCWR
ncbi:MAG: hypothetical protein HPM95_11885 [Alphaproteobacteria bacterium]|nr:hypothetical protein [Alphaproteobacteria bacterium]